MFRYLTPHNAWPLAMFLAFSLTACSRGAAKDPAGPAIGDSTDAEACPVFCDSVAENKTPPDADEQIPNSQDPEFPNSRNPEIPKFFVLLTDVCPDIILEIRYYTTYNFVGDRIPGYERPLAYLTREAADSLRAVSDDLIKQGYRLKVFDAYRPQQAVDFFVRWGKDMNDQRMKPYFYPDCPKSELFHRGYIAHRSGHTRGSTVDLTLFDMKTEREVDMGSTYDLLGEPSHYDYSQGITAEQRAHRRLLREVMVRHGFKPIACEWWHFTLRNEPFPNRAFNFPIR